MAYPKGLLRLSVEEYLALEEKSEVRHEYTELTDKRERLSDYFKLESLVEYVLISKDKKQVEIYRRGQRGEAQILVMGANDEVCFESSPNGALTLTMDDIYGDAIFNRTSQPSEEE